MTSRYALAFILLAQCTFSSLARVEVAQSATASTESASAKSDVWTAAGLTKEDADYIVNQSLCLIVQRKCPLGNMNFHRNPKLIPLLDTHLAGLDVRPVNDVQFEVVSEDTMIERAEADGAYAYYLHFESVTRSKSGTVVVQLDNVPKYASKSMKLAFGSGITIEFRNENGSWKHFCTTLWTS